MPANRPVTEEAIASRPDSVGVALVVISATGFGTLGILAKLMLVLVLLPCYSTHIPPF